MLVKLEVMRESCIHRMELDRSLFTYGLVLAVMRWDEMMEEWKNGGIDM